MSNPLLFFDTDCFSSFAWVDREKLLFQLYTCRIILPQHVFDELSHPSIPHIRRKVLAFESEGKISRMAIGAGTEEHTVYYQLTVSPAAGPLLGRGEAAAIALAKAHNGVLASNNLRDIRHYVELFRLQHITTGHILVQSLEQGLIDEDEGNHIWQQMLRRRRLLPAASFTEYITLMEGRK